MEEKEQLGNRTFSAKVAPELKGTIERLKEESGKSYDEFLSSLVATYETAQHRESVYDVRELNQLKNFIARIEEVYVSMAKSRKDIEESNAITVSLLQEELKEVKAELHDTKKISADEVAEAKEELLEARKEVESVLAEFDKLREGKDRAEKQTDAITSILEQQKHLISQLEDTASKSKAIADDATTSLETFKTTHDTLHNELQTVKAQLVAESNQAKIDKERAIVETLKESSKEIKELHDRIEALQNDKLKLTESLSIEREKVIKLEAKQTTPASKKVPPKKEQATPQPQA